MQSSYSAYTKHLESKTNFSTTENGAIQHTSTLNSCVDFFYATLQTPEEYYTLFLSALAEDRLTAMKILFWHRDIRSTGMGRRANFRHVLSKVNDWKWPGQDFTTAAILHYGRGDDLLSLLDTSSGKHALQEIETQLKAGNALVAKWMPRESSKKHLYRFYARRIANWMGWTSKQYRKNISALTSVVEQQMVSQKWNEIDFNKVPSQASLRYKNCFFRNAKENYLEWQESLVKEDGTTKVNVATLLPHQIVEKYGFLRPSSQDNTLEAMWKSLEKIENNCMVVADTSGSMSGTPLAVSLALALYFSETNPYNGFLTFSDKPTWHKFDKSHTLKQKLESIRSINCLNTDLQATFDLLFSAYVDTKIMPETVLIVSDMQFDEAVGVNSYNPRNKFDKVSFFNKMKRKFQRWDVPFPKLVFWNVRENISGSPVTFDEHGTALISGYSPAIMQTIMSLQDFDPEAIMINAIESINPTI